MVQAPRHPGATSPRSSRPLRQLHRWKFGILGARLLISLRAGGTGLNLTAAEYVTHLDPWWNPAVEDQASDRAHRIAQQRPVTIYRLVSVGTTEERTVALNHAKRHLAANLLEGRMGESRRRSWFRCWGREGEAAAASTNTGSSTSEARRTAPF